MKIVKWEMVVDATELTIILGASAIVREVVEIEQWSDEEGPVLYLVKVPYSVIRALKDIGRHIKEEGRKENGQKKKV